MSDISKEELKKEIAAILKNADFNSVTSKKVRQDVESKLDIDLSSRRKEVDELVMDFLENNKSKKKNGNVQDEDEEDDDNEEEEEDEDEEEEEVKKPKRGGSKKAAPAKRYKSGSSDESDDASDGDDDDYAPKKKGGATSRRKLGVSKKKKGGSDDDSDEDWGKGKKKGKKPAAAGGAAKRGGGGYTKPITLSPELAALVGESEMPRHEVVKRIWARIKERNLYDPTNKQFAICDDELYKVIGVKRFRTFGMMKFLKNHFLA